MKRDEMIEILHDCFNTVKEGIQSVKNQNVVPRAVYWDYVWSDVNASGLDYTDLNTYQISVFHAKPPRQNEGLIELRDKLRKAGVHPVIYHEYVEEDGIWHSYMSVEITE